MGLFKKKEKKEKKHVFMGRSMQPIGRFAINELLVLTLDPEEKVLKINNTDKKDDTVITLPFERIRGCKIEDEVTMAKGSTSISRALVGGALFGGAGAIIGANSKKGNTKVKWINTLIYEDKQGNIQELGFIQFGYPEYYHGEKKEYGASQFEIAVNRVASNNGEDITEL